MRRRRKGGISWPLKYCQPASQPAPWQGKRKLSAWWWWWRCWGWLWWRTTTGRDDAGAVFRFVPATNERKKGDGTVPSKKKLRIRKANFVCTYSFFEKCTYAFRQSACGMASFRVVRTENIWCDAGLFFCVALLEARLIEGRRTLRLPPEESGSQAVIQLKTFSACVVLTLFFIFRNSFVFALWCKPSNHYQVNGSRNSIRSIMLPAG